MRFGTKRSKHRHGKDDPTRVVPDSTAAVSAAAQEEARKGTAAADPVIGVTPEGETLPGSVVDGEFVAARDRVGPSKKTHGDDPVAAGEVPGENEAMADVWWTHGSPGEDDRG